MLNNLVEYLSSRTAHVAAIVNKMVEDQVLDRAYSALADPTRRRLLQALRDGDARITDLAAPLPMTFAGYHAISGYWSRRDSCAVRSAAANTGSHCDRPG